MFRVKFPVRFMLGLGFGIGLGLGLWLVVVLVFCLGVSGLA